jgi:hypothetical protein
VELRRGVGFAATVRELHGSCGGVGDVFFGQNKQFSVRDVSRVYVFFRYAL